MNLNYKGTIHTIKSLIAGMKRRREGYLVITASQAALMGIFGLSIYSSTKFALRGLAESLYMEVRVEATELIVIYSSIFISLQLYLICSYFS